MPVEQAGSDQAQAQALRVVSLLSTPFCPMPGPRWTACSAFCLHCAPIPWVTPTPQLQSQLSGVWHSSMRAMALEQWFL